MGKYSLIKVNSGVLKTDDLIYNIDNTRKIRMRELF